jgi:hypothetical protein
MSMDGRKFIMIPEMKCLVLSDSQNSIDFEHKQILDRVSLSSFLPLFNLIIFLLQFALPDVEIMENHPGLHVFNGALCEHDIEGVCGLQSSHPCQVMDEIEKTPQTSLLLKSLCNLLFFLHCVLSMLSGFCWHSFITIAVSVYILSL